MSSIYLTIPSTTSSVGSLTLNPGPLSIGPTPATAGDIRMSSGGTYIEWLNNATAANLIGIGFTTADELILGDASNVLGITENVVTGGTIKLQVNSVSMLTVGATYATIGAVASAATAGAIRLPNAARVMSLNNAGLADVQLVNLTSGDILQLGEATSCSGVTITTKTATTVGIVVNTTAALTVGTGYLTIGAVASAATAGHIRLPTIPVIRARNGANNADLNLVDSDGSDNLSFGDLTYTNIQTFECKSGGYAKWRVNSTQVFKAEAGAVTIGATAAAAGMLRMPKAATITGLDNAGAADIGMLTTDTSDILYVGDATNTDGVTIRAAAAATTGNITLAGHLVGGVFTQAMADAPQTVSAANSMKNLIITTGANTVVRALTLTAPPTAGTWKLIRNNCSVSGITVQFATGAATGTILPSTSAWVYGDGTDAQLAMVGT